MKLKQYSIYQISARTILNCARKTEDGYRFYFDINDETNQPAIQKAMQDDCAMFHQLLPLTDVPGEPALPEEDKLLSFLVYLDFTGIFDRKPTGQVKELQELPDLELLIDRILVFEDHLEIRLQADIDSILRSSGLEEAVNFNFGTENIEKTLIQSYKNHEDKVFRVNVISNGDPSQMTLETWQKFSFSMLDLAKRLWLE